MLLYRFQSNFSIALTDIHICTKLCSSDVAPILELKNVHKAFKDAHIINGVSFKVNAKEAHAIIGASGSGKSTLFRILLGYYSPDKGSILFRGKDITSNLTALRRVVGYTTQEDSFYDTLTPMENLRYYARSYRVKKSTTALLDTLREVELYDARDSQVKNMSGGMRRRLNFAISLVHDPEILILDEPTTGLDPRLVEKFWEIVKKVQKSGKTIIVTSHIFPELEKYTDRVSVLNKGKMSKPIKPTHLLKEFKKICYSTK